MIGRTNTGGGGGLQDTDAILRVIALAGSVVTITKGGVTKSDLGHENAIDNSLYDYYFIIHQSQFDSVNPWTVTATLGIGITSDTVLINSADEYDITLNPLVPIEYQAVEYLQSAGSARIGTNYLTSNNFGFELVAALTITSATSGTGYYNVFGGAKDSSSGMYFMTSNPGFYFKYNNRVTFNGDASKHKYWWKYNGSNYSYGTDGTQVGTDNTEPTVGAKFALFSFMDADGTVRSSNVLKGSIYSLKCYSGNTLNAHFVPCYRKSDSVAGMFDTISETFYTNLSGTAFVVGGDLK